MSRSLVMNGRHLLGIYLYLVAEVVKTFGMRLKHGKTRNS